MRHEVLSPTSAAIGDRIVQPWRKPLLLLALAWAALIALFASDWAAMAMQWWDSSTYNHILLVPPIIAWLVWQRAPELSQLTPQAWWPGLLVVAGALLLWLLGDISGLATAAQLGAVVMLQGSVLALLGPRVSWALLFPLAYGLFLVPIGDELVPALQMITAAITIWLTEFSGIPAMIEGVFIDTPVGLFEVAEACSGVKFLIAMIALGTLIANVCFRSWVRRMAFMAFAIALPILANGVRAWGTIYIAQSQGLEFASGFDHIFYGWVFFALVMAAVLAAGWRFFDRAVDESFVDVAAIKAATWPNALERFGARPTLVLGAIVAMALATMAWCTVARNIEADLPTDIAMPQVEGWTAVPVEQTYPWEPLAGGADRKLVGAYRDGEGRVVDVVLAVYAAQEDGREAGAFGQGALVPETEWRWLSPGPSLAGGFGERLQALGAYQRVAVTWYLHGEWTGGSRARLKLAAMRDRLLMRAEPTAMLILSAEQRAGQDAEQTVADFVQSTGDPGNWMDRAAGLD